MFGFDAHEYFRFSSSYLRSCIFSSRVGICSTVSCDSETDRETVSPLTTNFRSSVREQPRGSIALIKASKMRQTLGSAVSDIVSARNGTVSLFCLFRYEALFRFSFCQTAIFFLWAIILGCILVFSSGKMICAATDKTADFSSGVRNWRTSAAVCGRASRPVLTPDFAAGLSLCGSGPHCEQHIQSAAGCCAYPK